MNVDGEWRTAFIGREAPDLDYVGARAGRRRPAQLHQSGYINGTIVGIPGNAANKEQAWALVKYMTTDDAALAKLSNGLRNVLSTKSSAASPDLVPDPKFDTFLQIFAHPESSTTPVTAGGAPIRTSSTISCPVGRPATCLTSLPGSQTSTSRSTTSSPRLAARHHVRGRDSRGGTRRRDPGP